MFPCATRKKKVRRGRPEPDYGPIVCPWCCRKLRFDLATLKFYCECGWLE
jgi:hypothetical protein